MWAAVASGERPTALLVAGAVVYAVGVVGVTIAANVPRNDALAAVDPLAADTPGEWARYHAGWTAWNHVRTVAGVAAAAAFAVALAQ